MPTGPFLDERRLRRALEDQGFAIESTTKGARIVAPDGVGQAFVHLSTVHPGGGGKRAYANMVAKLARLGFDLDKIDAPNGRADEWKQERLAIEAEIAGTNEAVDIAAAEKAEAEEVKAAQVRAIRSLTPRERELFEAVLANPGHSNSTYAPDVNSGTTSVRAAHLIELGLIEKTGNRRSSRLWPIGEVDFAKVQASPTASPNGRPSASPVRVRQIEPGDAVQRFRRLGAKGLRLKAELEDIIGQMVAQYEDQEAELVEKRKRLRELESIFGKAVDRL